MDFQEIEMGCFDGSSWTDEKHSSFLSWMEASFVRKMLENDDEEQEEDCPSLTCAIHLPLDRYLSDTAESKLDFQFGTRSNGKTRSPSQKKYKGTLERKTRNDRRRRGSSRADINVSQDQVVPQLGSISKCKRSEKEEERK